MLLHYIILGKKRVVKKKVDFIRVLAFFIFCVVGGSLYIRHVERQGAENVSLFFYR